jgi:hypothetical protein
MPVSFAGKKAGSDWSCTGLWIDLAASDVLTNHEGGPYQASSVLLRGGKCGIANLKSGKHEEVAAALPAAADIG